MYYWIVCGLGLDNVDCVSRDNPDNSYHSGKGKDTRTCLRKIMVMSSKTAVGTGFASAYQPCNKKHEAKHRSEQVIDLYIFILHKERNTSLQVQCFGHVYGTHGERRSHCPTLNLSGYPFFPASSVMILEAGKKDQFSCRVGRDKSTTHH